MTGPRSIIYKNMSYPSYVFGDGERHVSVRDSVCDATDLKPVPITAKVDPRGDVLTVGLPAALWDTETALLTATVPGVDRVYQGQSL